MNKENVMKMLDYIFDSSEFEFGSDERKAKLILDVIKHESKDGHCYNFDINACITCLEEHYIETGHKYDRENFYCVTCFREILNKSVKFFGDAVERCLNNKAVQPKEKNEL